MKLNKQTTKNFRKWMPREDFENCFISIDQTNSKMISFENKSCINFDEQVAEKKEVNTEINCLKRKFLYM